MLERIIITGGRFLRDFDEMYELKPSYKKKMLQEKIDSVKGSIEMYESTLKEKRESLRALEKELGSL